jgi:hypothetical protein
MGDGALTKAQLDEMTIEWRRWRQEVGMPISDTPVVKTMPSEPMLSSRDRALAQGFAQGIAPTIHALEQQVSELQARVAELERSQKTYLGVWKAGREYSAMSEVTLDGARWFCCKSTSNKPGTSADWTMMEKSTPTSTPRSDTTATSRTRENGHYARARSP